MKASIAFASTLISTVALAQIAPVATAPAPDLAAAATTASGAPALPGPVQSIRDSRDPSAAINAYAQALTWANGRAEDVTLVENTYVQQMIEFGVPEMAEVQAQDLITRDPRNGVAWAVAAHIAAKRNDPNAALSTAAKLKVSFPVLLDTDKKVSKLYDLNTMPSTVVIDRDGKMRFLHRGYRAGTEADYEQQIRGLLKE